MVAPLIYTLVYHFIHIMRLIRIKNIYNIIIAIGIIILLLYSYTYIISIIMTCTIIRVRIISRM